MLIRKRNYGVVLIVVQKYKQKGYNFCLGARDYG